MDVSTDLDIDLVALEADEVVSVMLELTAAAAVAADGPRPEQAVVVVLDRSGSMGGERLDAAKTALTQLIGRLEDRDRFGLVVFDNESQVVVPANAVGINGRDGIRQAIAGVQTGGSTDLSSGYLRGLQEARRVAGATGATVVLLSDGQANSGVTDPDRLRAVAAQAQRARSPPRPSASAPGTTRRSSRPWPTGAAATTPSPSTPTARSPPWQGKSTACSPRRPRRPACSSARSAG